MDYKDFVLTALKTKPKAGHGQFLKIAKALGIHTTMVTHVLKGDLHLNPEQCLALTDFLGLSELETEYFVTLVQLARAGNERTRRYFNKKIAQLKERALNLSVRLETKNTLDEKDQAVFYSSWIYSAVRLLSAIPSMQSRDMMAQELNLSLAKVNRTLEFLLSRGLCEERENKIIYRDLKTYVDQESPLVTRHHMNWRLRVISQLDRLELSDLVYTNPIVISEKDYFRIRDELIQFIEKFKKISEPSPSENLYCLNIDWLKIKS